MAIAQNSYPRELFCISCTSNTQDNMQSAVLQYEERCAICCVICSKCIGQQFLLNERFSHCWMNISFIAIFRESVLHSSDHRSGHIRWIRNESAAAQSDTSAYLESTLRSRAFHPSPALKPEGGRLYPRLNKWVLSLLHGGAAFGDVRTMMGCWRAANIVLGDEWNGPLSVQEGFSASPWDEADVQLGDICMD